MHFIQLKLEAHFTFCSRFYKLQREGLSYDNLEIMLRKINPNVFTWSQHGFKDLIEKEGLLNVKYDKLVHKTLKLATLNVLGQDYDKVPGIVG